MPSYPLMRFPFFANLNIGYHSAQNSIRIDIGYSRCLDFAHSTTIPICFVIIRRFNLETTENRSHCIKIITFFKSFDCIFSL